ncbi:diguanylate cyclase [Roseibium sp.]|uniref:sensor domain-containing diguanylate cyclase n=1 Tax=Roseibium sp. TaxID=1936156 RepID=UPI003A96DA14
MQSNADETSAAAIDAKHSKFRTLPIVALTALVMFACISLFSVFIDQTMSQYMRTHEEEDSIEKAETIARFVTMLPGNFTAPANQLDIKSAQYIPLHKEIGQLAQTIGARITIISANGMVLGDSGMSYYQLLHADNHAGRPEVVGALETGMGISERHSATLGIDFLYTAVSFERKGSPVVARVAVQLKDLYAQQTHLRRLLALGTVSGVLIIGGITFLLGRALARSINSKQNRLETAVAERTATLREMQELGSLLAICNNLGEAAEVLEMYLPRLLPGSSGALSLMNNSRNLMIVEHEWGGYWQKGTFTAPDSCWSLRKNAVHHSQKGDLVCHHLDDQPKDHIVCIPLMAQGETLGIIHLRQAPNQPFTVDELNISQSIGKETAIAISNLKLRETLEQQALHDPLTGLFNRRFLEEQYDSFVNYSRQGGKPLWLMIIDVDHFKTYNDQYGHDAGDFVLTQLARQFRQSVKGDNVACRLGGEEFAIVMPNLSYEEALHCAEELRKSVEQLEFKQDGRPLGEVTISAGLAACPNDGELLASVLKCADELLYKAKRNGRNQVCARTSEDTPEAGTVDDLHSRLQAF